MSKIIKCKKSNVAAFTSIMNEAFIDKYPKFFSGIKENSYISILNQLNQIEFEHNSFYGKYLILWENEEAGALEFFIARKKYEMKRGFNILKKYLGVLKAIKIGLMLLGFGPPINFPNKTLYVDKVGVLTKHRGKGLGKKLMIFAIEFAKKIGCKFVELEVIPRNKKAIALYKSLGFEIVKTTNTILGQRFVGVDSYYLMRKKIIY